MTNLGTPTITLILLLAAIALPVVSKAAQPQLCAANVCVNVEIVSSAADMQRGLQGREGLAADHGMLFVFPDDGLHQFWMKDMKFPIDMIWLDGDRHIVTIAANVPVCTAHPCQTYGPSKISRYVLEVNSDYAAQHQLKAGGQFEFKDAPSQFIAQPDSF